MSWVSHLLIGVAIGVAISLPLAWIAVQRSVRRARLAERRARNAERMAEIGAMTGGLAHEIRNPLSTLGLNAQLLSEAIAELPIEQAERDRLSKRIGVQRREIERLRDILEGFLRFAGELRLDPAPTDLNTLLEELSDFYLPQAQRNGVHLRLSLTPGPVLAHVDASQFKQALLNLMINATQAMSRDERRSAEGVAASELILRTELDRDESGPVCRVHITDTGPGIDPEKMDRIFHPYFTTRSGGTGLGLAISRRIVDEHGGRIEAHSEPGRGTDFIITLPRPLEGAV